MNRHVNDACYQQSRYRWKYLSQSVEWNLQLKNIHHKLLIRYQCYPMKKLGVGLLGITKHYQTFLIDIGHCRKYRDLPVKIFWSLVVTNSIISYPLTVALTIKPKYRKLKMTYIKRGKYIVLYLIYYTRINRSFTYTLLYYLLNLEIILRSFY